jgi:enoyl-CoA hydratase/carnithine racemase
VICALNGAAVGGGAALAMACDLVVAAEEASYSFPFGQLGVSAADMGCAHMLPRLVGTARAKQILLTGATVSASQGKLDGLFIDVVPGGKVLEVALHLAQNIVTAGSRRALAGTKLALLRGEANEYSTALSYELYLQCYMLNTPEHNKRLRAFVDGRSKNKPRK